MAAANPGGAPSSWSHLKLAAIGLAIGALATFAFAFINLSGPAFSTYASLLLSKFGVRNDGLDFSGPRIGRAGTAPALKLCLTKNVMGLHEEIDILPDMMLTALRASESQGRVTREPGTPREHAVLELAQMWGEVADCIYRQNAFRLCDIDNRALAVEAGGTFIRQTDRILAGPQTAVAAEPGEFQALRSTRDRVLDLIHNRVQRGVLVASDFPSSFAPAAVRAVLNGTKTLRNECDMDKARSKTL